MQAKNANIRDLTLGEIFDSLENIYKDCGNKLTKTDVQSIFRNTFDIYMTLYDSRNKPVDYADILGLIETKEEPKKEYKPKGKDEKVEDDAENTDEPGETEDTTSIVNGVEMNKFKTIRKDIENLLTKVAWSATVDSADMVTLTHPKHNTTVQLQAQKTQTRIFMYFNTGTDVPESVKTDKKIKLLIDFKKSDKGPLTLKKDTVYTHRWSAVLKKDMCANLISLFN